MASTKETLEQARALIADPERWTQGSYARDEDGCSIWDLKREGDRACKWCSLGALQATVLKSDVGYATAEQAADVLEDCTRTMSGQYVAEFNDFPERQHAEILTAFDCAIAKASD